jgi:hypothetical protein
MLNQETIKSLINYSLAGCEHSEHHITRFAMYKCLAGKWAKHAGANKSCLSISNSAHLGRILGLSDALYDEVSYPSGNILNLSSYRNYDFCVSDQVLEHVEGNPFEAFQQSVDALKPGGLVCHTTCFINPIHGVPKDFWRFTPDALSLLAQSCNCEEIETSSWGNREAWDFIELGYRFAKLPKHPSHPLTQLALRNEPEWPIVTWVLAKKRSH